MKCILRVIAVFSCCKFHGNRPQPSPHVWKPYNLIMQSSHLSHSPAHDSNLIWALAGNSTVLPVYQRSAVSVKQQKKREGVKEKKGERETQGGCLMWTDECGLWWGGEGEGGDEKKKDLKGCGILQRARQRRALRAEGDVKTWLISVSFCADVSSWLLQLDVKVMDTEFGECGSFHSAYLKKRLEGWQ